jgi:hypothetical protein
MLYAVAYRYGVASVDSMDYDAIKFWHRGHEYLLAEEERQLKAREQLG